MFEGRRDDLINALESAGAHLGPERFVYGQLIEAAIVPQVKRAGHYLLPRGGYADRLEMRDQTPGPSRSFRLPESEIFLEWEVDGDEWYGALAFKVDGASNIASVIPKYWRMYFPRQFSPRIHMAAVVPFRCVSGEFVLPEVALVFGTSEFFWRNVANPQPLRASIRVRDPLCLENPEAAPFTREATAQIELGTSHGMAMWKSCAYCVGVLESLCTSVDPVSEPKRVVASGRRLHPRRM